jgi:hypothetical protein
MYCAGGYEDVLGTCFSNRYKACSLLAIVALICLQRYYSYCFILKTLSQAPFSYSYALRLRLSIMWNIGLNFECDAFYMKTVFSTDKLEPHCMTTKDYTFTMSFTCCLKQIRVSVPFMF